MSLDEEPVLLVDARLEGAGLDGEGVRLREVLLEDEGAQLGDADFGGARRALVQLRLQLCDLPLEAGGAVRACSSTRTKRSKEPSFEEPTAKLSCVPSTSVRARGAVAPGGSGLVLVSTTVEPCTIGGRMRCCGSATTAFGASTSTGKVSVVVCPGGARRMSAAVVPLLMTTLRSPGPGAGAAAGDLPAWDFVGAARLAAA